MGYGGLPNFTEYDSAGHVLLDATLGQNVQDFRTFLAPWSAQPKTLPAVAVQAAGAGALRMSRRAGTARRTVSSWKVLAGPQHRRHSRRSRAPRAAAFETTIALPLRRPPTSPCRRSTAPGHALATSAAIPTAG